MPTSYKICIPVTFEEEHFNHKPYQLDSQHLLEGVEPPPLTQIYQAKDRIGVEGLSSFIIEHEYEDTAVGRYAGKSFTKFIRKEFIKAFYGKNKQLLLLSGKKHAVLDFCKRSSSFRRIAIKTIELDMKELFTQLPNIRGVWFNFKNGPISASALMGSHIEDTADFKKFRNSGDMSTLSFFFEYDGSLHPVMVTEDGTVVLQSNYREKSNEIEIVLALKEALLDVVSKAIEKKAAKKTKS